jgi:hypothetical protein
MKANALLCLLLLTMVAGWGQSVDVRPGLWDFTTTVQMGGMPPIPNLDQMPPEQRARIEAAVKGMSGTPHTEKSCVTKGGLEKAIAEANGEKNNTCTSKVVNGSSSRADVHIECAPQKGEQKMVGDFTVERQDSEHMKGNGVMKTAGANGRTMDMKWSMTGTFVSADCGNLKPAGAR